MIALVIVLVALALAWGYLAVIGITWGRCMRIHGRDGCKECEYPSGGYHNAREPDPDGPFPYVLSALWPLTWIGFGLWFVLVRPAAKVIAYTVRAGARIGR